MLSYRNLTESIQKSAKSKEEAVELALNEFGAKEEDVNVEVVEEASKGFLGLGTKEAVVNVSLKDVAVFRAKKFLNEVFRDFGMEVQVTVTRNENGIAVDLAGVNMGIVIGKRGETLDSLQYLTSLVANIGLSRDDYSKVSLDTENYREKRNEALVALSERLAAKVTKTGKRYTLEPMNPYERRIIHANLQNSETVTTFSIGEDPYRKVVIAPKNEKPYTRKKRSYRRDEEVAENVEVHETTPVIDEVTGEELPMTYPGGGQNGRFNKNKAGSFEEYLARENGDILG